MSEFELGEAFAIAQDKADPLANYRQQFYLPQYEQQDMIYLCGNSLGLQPKTTAAEVDKVLWQWRNQGVNAHFHGDEPWLDYVEALLPSLAKLTGALPQELTLMNALTVNLHLFMISFYRPTKKRYKILMEAEAFSSDQYAVKSQLRFHGFDANDALLEIAPQSGKHEITMEDILTVIEQHGNEIALVLLGGVQYRTGQVFDMPAITAAAHAKGITVGFDLAHGVGNIDLSLHDWDVDFAVWCSYKYLNGGPGAPGGCFVHQRHLQHGELPRFEGWWGNDKQSRFAMAGDFAASATAQAWQVSNPPMLQLAALRASLELFDEAGFETLRQKSQQLTAYLVFLLQQQLSHAVDIVTPQGSLQQGCQVSLRLGQNADEVERQLMARGVCCDSRRGGVLRASPVPLYNSFHDVYRFVEVLQAVLPPP